MLRDILVFLDDTEASDSRTRLAVGLATEFGAVLTGLFVIPIWPARYTMAYGEVLSLTEIADRYKESTEKGATDRKKYFEAAAKRAAIPYEFRIVHGIPESAVVQHGRYADLIITGMNDDKTPDEFLAVSDSVVLDSGRPVLLVPNGYDNELLFRSVLVAWNNSRQAVRALNDAMPLMAKASVVKVVSVNPKSLERENPAADIALHIARHDIDVSADHIDDHSGEVGDSLLRYAVENKSDLIVAGAYGHTRFTEIILGGVTRFLLKNSPLPVLMSH